MLMAMASATLNSGRSNAAIFRKLQMVKLHELLIPDQIWLVEFEWSVEIQLKVTCARSFSCRALALPTSGLARKRSSLIDQTAPRSITCGLSEDVHSQVFQENQQPT